MKKKKISLFTPIILLSFSLILLITLISLVPKNPSCSSFPSNPSAPSLPPVFSFRDLFSSPAFHPTPLTSLVAVGDIMLGRYCNVQMLKKKDFKYPFLKTAHFTSNADITFGNLEAPFIEDCPTTKTGMIFCSRPEAIEGIQFAGFDVLSLANNHILNYGPKGLEQTQKFLQSAKILYSPLPSPNSPLTSSNSFSNYQDNKTTRYQAGNLSFGFLSFDLVTFPQKFTFTHDREQKSTMELIKSEAKNSDILIVSFHWGTEYQKDPSKWQKELAHEIIDVGAKVIIGHHPHVTQPVEEYKNGLIFYSLGNFVFDQPWSEETKKGNIAKIIFEGKNIKSYELIPVYIENYCQPKLLN